MTPAPRWLLARLEAAGELGNPDGHTPTAQPAACNHCAAPVLAGTDNGGLMRVAFAAVVDPIPLTPAGEAWALITGRNTYRLRGRTAAALTLQHRDAFLIERSPIGRQDLGGAVVVVAAHKCGQEIPAEYHAEKD